MAKSIVQIQLLDEDTGQVLETVIPESEARAIVLANGKDLETYLSELELQKGERGEPGPKGDKGDRGDPGSKLFNVTATPANTLGVVGDWALNTVNGDVYEKTGSATWERRGNFKGPKGDTGSSGPKGDKGEQGPRGDIGPKGDKGDPGDRVKYGDDYTDGQQVRLFLKRKTGE